MSVTYLDHRKSEKSKKTNQIDDFTKEDEIQALLNKTEDVLRAGGFHATTLIVIIVKFWERFIEEAQ